MTGRWSTLVQTYGCLAASALFWLDMREQVGRRLRRAGQIENCWMSSPPGSAFLYVRREVQHLIEPLVVSWGWNRDAQTSEV